MLLCNVGSYIGDSMRKATYPKLDIVGRQKPLSLCQHLRVFSPCAKTRGICACVPLFQQKETGFG